MDVLKKVVAKPGWITRHVVVVLFVAFASCGVVFSQGQRTGGPTPSGPGAEVYFIDLKDGTTVPAKLKIYFGLRNMGVAPRRIGPRELRSSPSARRHGVAAARPADSQRLQPPSLRRRADRSDCDPFTWAAYASTPARGRKSRATQSPDHVEADQGLRGQAPPSRLREQQLTRKSLLVGTGFSSIH